MFMDQYGDVVRQMLGKDPVPDKFEPLIERVQLLLSRVDMPMPHAIVALVLALTESGGGPTLPKQKPVPKAKEIKPEPAAPTLPDTDIGYGPKTTAEAKQNDEAILYWKQREVGDPVIVNWEGTHKAEFRGLADNGRLRIKFADGKKRAVPPANVQLDENRVPVYSNDELEEVDA